MDCVRGYRIARSAFILVYSIYLPMYPLPRMAALSICGAKHLWEHKYSRGYLQHSLARRIQYSLGNHGYREIWYSPGRDTGWIHSCHRLFDWSYKLSNSCALGSLLGKSIIFPTNHYNHIPTSVKHYKINQHNHMLHKAIDVFL